MLTNTDFNNLCKALYSNLDESHKFSVNGSGWNALSAQVAQAMNASLDMRKFGFEQKTLDNFNVHVLKAQLKLNDIDQKEKSKSEVISDLKELYLSVFGDVLATYEDDMIAMAMSSEKTEEVLQNLCDLINENITEISLEIFPESEHNPLAREKFDYIELAFDILKHESKKPNGESRISYAKECSLGNKSYSHLEETLFVSSFIFVENCYDHFWDLLNELFKGKYSSSKEVKSVIEAHKLRLS